MLGDKGFVAILGGVMTVVYTSILVVVAVILIILGGFQVAKMLVNNIKELWKKHESKRTPIFESIQSGIKFVFKN